MESFAELCQAIAAAITAARLLQFGLSRRQPALFTFLVLDAVSLFALGAISRMSAIYFWLYLIFDGLHWIASVFVVREMFALVLDRYPGIKTAGRWAMYVSLTIALTSSLLVVRAFWGGGPNGRARHLFYLLVADRSVVFTLSVMVILILLILSRYPLDLHPNTYVSSIFFSAFFISEGLSTLIDSLDTRLYSPIIDTVQIGFAALCFVGWAMMLRPIRETAPARVKFPSPEEHELLEQLESLNRLLSRAGRQ